MTPNYSLENTPPPQPPNLLSLLVCVRAVVRARACVRDAQIIPVGKLPPVSELEASCALSSIIIMPVASQKRATDHSLRRCFPKDLV